MIDLLVLQPKIELRNLPYLHDCWFLLAQFSLQIVCHVVRTIRIPWLFGKI